MHCWVGCSRSGRTRPPVWVAEQTRPGRQPMLTFEMTHLLRLIYVSQATGSTDPPSLEALMKESRSRHEMADVTGILCGGRGYFMQALEGSETQVTSLNAGILRDARHQHSAVLSIGLVSSRAFPHWATAYVDGEPLAGELHARLVDDVLLDRGPSQPVRLLQATLKSLRKAA